ncbi:MULTISPECIES: DUF262 domain-containing protein [Actinomycetes]|uniref:DUF262 domain-containing protein n=1 Tax=Actinomycetes TaxID=1760 RepID=UPI0004C185DD|nr:MULTISPECIES: DUF262 domain-containing protein [Actinomycetes]
MVSAKPSHENYSDLLSQIRSGQIKIPQFQRDFVWTINRSAALLDSVIKGYPVGTFIFWKTDERLRSVKDIGGDTLPEPPEGQYVNYVLDGQQRLTSLYAAIEGKSVKRESGSIDDFSKIYVNLEASEHDPIVTEEHTGLAEGSYITLTELLNGGLGIAKKYDKRYWDVIEGHSTRIKSYSFPVTSVSSAAIDVATEIFTRINVGGKTLTTYEIMAAKTYDEKQDFDLTVKSSEISDRLTQVNYETIPEITPLQLIALILEGECKRETILNLDKGDFIKTWPDAISALESAVDHLRSSYGVAASRLLPYNGLLIPFAYFYFANGGKKPNANQAKLLTDFFWRCSLGGRYSSGLEGKLAQDRSRIDKIIASESPAYDWPVDTSPEFILRNGWFTPSRSFAKAILCLYASLQPRSFDNNGIVAVGNAYLKQANSKNYHHFFPKAYLKKEGFSLVQANNIVNITIIDAHLNKNTIRAKAPSKYMKDFKDSNPNMDQTMASHLLDDYKPYGFGHDDYNSFLQKRAKRISDELQMRIVPQQIDAGGQAEKADDFDPEGEEFE